MKKRVYNLLFNPGLDDKAARWVNIILVALIVISSLTAVLETVETLSAQFGIGFRIVEDVAILLFTLEYIARIWACTEDKKYRGFISGRIYFALQPLSIIDFLAIIPFYLPMIGADLVMLRLMRLVRIARILKLARYNKAILILFKVARSKKEEIGVTFFISTLLLVIAASLAYAVEHEAQPEAFSSIPAALWWAIVVASTIGFGDVVTATIAGKIITVFLALLGIGVVALPTATLAAGFQEALSEEVKENICPHCGRNINV